MTESSAVMHSFLFTDIEASTRRWEDQPGAMRAALEVHDEILRESIEANGGRVFKHTGDGCCAVFDSASGAVSAAATAQRALAAQVWGEMAGLRVRMGIHTGEAPERDGDYFGPVLNHAARLMDAGHGGQVLVSAVTRELVGDQLDDRLGLVDLGVHRLRDLSRSEAIFQLVGESLDGEFPALRTPDTTRSNLPLQVTSFVGREAEVSELVDLLGQARVVTLTGVGGVGKTRLALRAAGKVLAGFADGVWLVELAPLRDERAVGHAVADLFGVQRQGDRSMTDCLVGALAERQALVVFDNCEHLLGVIAGLVERLVRSCPEITVLATSREALAVGGEHIIQVGSLSSYRDGGVFGSAVELFGDRAHAVHRDFVLTDEAEVVAEICGRLDGVALAIELAAARVRSMSVREIADRLDDRFRLLTGGRRVAIERHQTLRAAVEWSYRLLSDDEQRLFASLSVFVGGFTLEAAEAVCALDGLEGPGPTDLAGTGFEGLDGAGVADLVGGLVDKSMIEVQHRGDDLRYRLLETLRQYAAERLAERGDSTQMHERHARFFAKVAARSKAGYRGRKPEGFLAARRAEHDNLRAAFEWAVDTGDTALAVRIVGSLAHAFSATEEIQDWLGTAVNLPGADEHAGWASAAAYATLWALNRGSIDEGEALARRALDHATDHEDDALLDARWSVAMVPYRRREPAASSEFKRLVGLAREREDTGYEIFGLGLQGASLALIEGDIDAAVEVTELAVELARSFENTGYLAFALMYAGTAVASRDPDRARILLTEAIASADRIALGFVPRYARLVLSNAEGRLGDPRAALAVTRDALMDHVGPGSQYMIRSGLLLAVEALGQLYADATIALLHGGLGGPSILGPDDAQRYMTAIENVSDRLGNERFEALVADGARLSFDKVAEYAIDALNSLLDTDTPGDDDG